MLDRPNHFIIFIPEHILSWQTVHTGCILYVFVQAEMPIHRPTFINIIK